MLFLESVTTLCFRMQFTDEGQNCAIGKVELGLLNVVTAMSSNGPNRKKGALKQLDEVMAEKVEGARTPWMASS